MKIGHVNAGELKTEKFEKDIDTIEPFNSSSKADEELATIAENCVDWGLGKNAQDIDSSFRNNVKAVLYKRFRTYKNGKISIIFEIAPILMGILGICIVSVADEWPNSPSVTFSVDLVPKGS